MTSSLYGDSWDKYVNEIFERSKRADSVYPGDEWGNREWWNSCYERLFEYAGAGGWRHAVEIGPGSGKYTLLLLERSMCQVLALDVSEAFLQVLRTRAADQIRSRHLDADFIHCRNPDEVLTKIEQRGWRGAVDGFFSIDAMVHVDLQYLVAYLVTAAICLRPGGKLLLTLADATSARGQRKLLDEIKIYYPLQGQSSLKFEWLSPDIVRSLLATLGFRIVLLEHDSLNRADARDMFLIAERTSTDLPALETYLR